jgi:hypothetical protein
VPQPADNDAVRALVQFRTNRKRREPRMTPANRDHLIGAHRYTSVALF